MGMGIPWDSHGNGKCNLISMGMGMGMGAMRGCRMGVGMVKLYGVPRNSHILVKEFSVLLDDYSTNGAQHCHQTM